MIAEITYLQRVAGTMKQHLDNMQRKIDRLQKIERAVQILKWADAHGTDVFRERAYGSLMAMVRKPESTEVFK